MTSTGTSRETVFGRVEIVIVAGSCCNAGAAPLDEQAQRSVEQAVAAHGGDAKVRTITAGDAIAGALPDDILADLQTHLERDGLQPPIVMIGGQIIASGMITVGEIESGLKRYGEQSGRDA